MDDKTLMQRFIDEAINGRNLDAIDELLSEDFVEHEELPGLEPNREGVKQFFGMMEAAFPDLRFTVRHLLSDGDMVVAHSVVTGTHTGGDFMGIPASGKAVEVAVIDLVRFSDGVGVEHWGVADMATMLQQLGAMPPPG